MLQTEVITQLSPQDGKAGQRLVEEWSELAQACPTATVFQTPEWLATWWTILGKAGRGRRLHLIAAREGRTLVGLIPLMRAPWYGLPVRRLTFVGAGASDYGDAIAAPGREDDVADAFYGLVKQEPATTVIDLRELRQGGLLRERLPSRNSGLSFADYPLESAPYVDLPEDGPLDRRWETLLSGYTKKARSNIGYYERTLRRTFSVEHRIVSREGDLNEAFETLFELHRRRWNRRWLPGVFTSQRVRSFHVHAGRKLLERGWLRLHLLLLDDEVQAALYAFAFHDRTCYYQGGFEPELARYSLGSVLIGMAIRQAIQEEFPVFDFLRGNEEYKQRWTQGGSHANIRRLVARSGGATLALAERVHRAESAVETRMKALFAAGIVNKAAAIRKPRPAGTTEE